MPEPFVSSDTTDMHVTAIGRTRILANTVEEVHSAGHEIDCIITCAAADFYDVTAEDFRELADRVDAEYHFYDSVSDDGLLDILERLPSEVAVSVNWKYLLGQSVLEVFPHGILNAHAGDLPRYRGNAAPNWAILNGEDEVVLTVHQMEPEIDAGPIIAQSSVPVTEETYLGEVYEAMETTFPELFTESLSEFEAGTATLEPQPTDPADALRGYPRTPKDSEIDWSQSSEYLHRLVRASAEPLFGAFTYLGTEKLRVWRARTEQPPHDYCGAPGQVAERRPGEGEVAVITSDGFLILEEVQLGDDQRCPATEVITSIRTRLGMDKETEIRRLNDRISELESRLAEFEE